MLSPNPNEGLRVPRVAPQVQPFPQLSAIDPTGPISADYLKKLVVAYAALTNDMSLRIIFDTSGDEVAATDDNWVTASHLSGPDVKALLYRPDVFLACCRCRV